MMETLSQAAGRIGARLHGADAAFARVVSDTRLLRPGDLYVALRGEHHDGNDFVDAAAAAGAAGALVSRKSDSALPQLQVEDTLSALQTYGESWRGDFELPVVAVTGSNGKTTTKQMLAGILKARGPVLATQGNLNNHIGVPLTLLGLRTEHRTAVIEMGANHAGEIALLTRLARPQIGIVTQAGDAHLEGFGSREGVARAKGELYAGLPENGIAVINADDAYAPLWRSLAGGAAVIRFGFHEDADVRALNLTSWPTQTPTGVRFELQTPEGRAGVELPLPGRHNVMNALAAAAAGVALGLAVDEIAEGLRQMQLPQGRVSWKHTRGGARLIDDSYNANPTSLRAGLELLAAQAGERWAVLGAMAELGADSAILHQEAGALTRTLGIDRCYAVGPMARHYAAGYGEGARSFEQIEALLAALESDLHREVTLLVKGSRSARMERVVAALSDERIGEAH